MTKRRSTKIPTRELLAALTEPETSLPAALLRRLSDISDEDFALYQDIWRDVPVERRRLLMSRLAEAVETDFEVDYERVATYGLEDDDPTVRMHAIDALFIHTDVITLRHMIRMMELDEDEGVRAKATSALGRFVLAGELGELDERQAGMAVEALLEVLGDLNESPEVRRRALESFANSSRDEVASYIEEALEDPNPHMQVSALYAMGRSGDEHWGPHILDALESPTPELRYEAARAAGELTLLDAVPRLAEMTRERDREIKEAAIWALGEIGGNKATRALMRLLKSDPDLDDELVSSIEDALNMAALGAGDFAMYLLEHVDEVDPVPDDEDEA